jgi:uncharacterized lipoprotein YmbA
VTRRRVAHPSAGLSVALIVASVPPAALAVSVIATAITGCGYSAPTRYVTLSADLVDARAATVRIPPVQLTVVHIPAELDRPEVVTQISPNRLSIDESAQWGAPLDQMMRRTLAQDLMARLSAGSFIFPDAPAPADARTLVVTVLSVQSDANGALTLQVAWALLSGQPARTISTHQATLKSELTSSDAAAQAAALSRILGQLADRIAASVVTPS